VNRRLIRVFGENPFRGKPGSGKTRFGENT
jgi:hypothetical protein